MCVCVIIVDIFDFISTSIFCLHVDVLGNCALKSARYESLRKKQQDLQKNNISDKDRVIAVTEETIKIIRVILSDNLERNCKIGKW